jgi:predicted dehydrogenase
LKRVFPTVTLVDDVAKLAGLGLDAIYVTTPIPSHYPVVKAVFAGDVAKNVFVEKTLANTADEAQELAGLAGRGGGVSMVGYLRRFYVTFRKARELVTEHALGDLSSFDIHAFSSDFLDAKPEDATGLARGGVLRDLGCHALDMALWYFGDFTIEPDPPDSRGSDDGNTVLQFQGSSPSGLVGRFRVSWCMEGYRMPEVGVSIVGSKGRLEVNDDLVRLTPNEGRPSMWYRHDLNDNVPFWLGLPEYYREDAYFIDAMTSAGRAEPDFASAAKVDAMIAQVEQLEGLDG